MDFNILLLFLYTPRINLSGTNKHAIIMHYPNY